MQHRQEFVFVSDFVPPVWQMDESCGSAVFLFHSSGGLEGKSCSIKNT